MGQKELSQFNARRSEFDQFQRDARDDLADFDDAAAEIEAVKTPFTASLKQLDQLIAATLIKYLALAEKSDVMAAIEKMGGSLGPSEKFVGWSSEFDGLFGRYESRAHQASRGVDVMSCGPLPGSVKTAAEGQSPQEFLPSLGLEKKGDQWLLLCESQLVSDVRAAEKLNSRRQKAFRGAPKAKRSEIERGIKSALRKANSLESENPLKSDGIISLTELTRWQKKRVATVGAMRRLQEQEMVLSGVEQKVAVLTTQQRLLAERAIKKSEKLQTHYKLLASDPQVKKALAADGGELGPSKNFSQQVRKANSVLRKLPSSKSGRTKK